MENNLWLLLVENEKRECWDILRELMMSFSHHVGDQDTNKSYTNDLNLFTVFLSQNWSFLSLRLKNIPEQNTGILGSTVKDRYNSCIQRYPSQERD